MDLRHAASVAKRAHLLRERVPSTRVDAGRTGTPDLAIVPANEATWDDLQAVFGTRGDRGPLPVPAVQAPAEGGVREVPVEERARRLREQTGCGHPESETTSGLVAYLDGEPVGWCAVEPRTAYPASLRNNRVPWEGRTEDKADDSVWAVTCFFARAGFRRRGISRALARAAVDFARERGARAIEGYPMLTKPGRGSAGASSTSAAAASSRPPGSSEVSQPTLRRVVMRIDF